MASAVAFEARPAYLNRAFFSQYNLILLGGCALFSLASASPLPLAVGASVELVWLLIGPRLKAFRSYVDGLQLAARESQLDDEVSSGMQTLAAVYTQRIVAFAHAISELRALAHGPSGAESRTLQLALAELAQLRPAYLRVCELHQRLSRAIGEGTDGYVAEIARLSEVHSTEKDLGMKLALRQAINAAQRAIDRHGRLLDVRRATELKLLSLERAVSQLRAQLAAHAQPDELVQEIRQAVAELSSIGALEAEAAG